MASRHRLAANFAFHGADNSAGETVKIYLVLRELRGDMGIGSTIILRAFSRAQDAEAFAQTEVDRFETDDQINDAVERLGGRDGTLRALRLLGVKAAHMIRELEVIE
jgi:hypothetical protein